MKIKKTKILLVILFLLFTMFFSNDFGLIDIEKTAIITAIAIDKEDDGSFTATAEVAVPEPTKNVTDNKKTKISGNGDTVGKAIKNIGNVSGFFPLLTFCNLIILGEEVANDNVLSAMDYFSRSLRIQDSALLILAEGKGADVLDYRSPLDQISSFAIQKVILKASGFDMDTVKMDVKTFSADYYSDASSSYMPKIKPVQTEESDSGGGENSSGQGGKEKETLFSTTTTALFFKGIKVGELDDEQTSVFNMFSSSYDNGTLPVNGVPTLTGENDFLLTVIKAKPKIYLSCDDDGISANLSLSLFCKISDKDSSYSDADFVKDTPLPAAVSEKAEEYLKEKAEELIEKSKATNCDFFKLKELLYRKLHEKYGEYKDDLLSQMRYKIEVEVKGQC